MQKFSPEGAVYDYKDNLNIAGQWYPGQFFQCLIYF